MKPQTLKGFRDFLPEQTKKRQYVIDTLRKVFESYGFEPLETPALEYEEVLLGKYGEEGDKLMYRFTDKGKRKVAMKYDLTVPLARVVSQYQDMTLPFKRYQIQPVWRADKPQKGRYREFLQCDIDIVGSDSLSADAEILALVYDCYKRLNLTFTIKINDRKIFEGINPDYLPIIDKLEKISKEGVLKELKETGELNPEEILKKITKMTPTPLVNEVMRLYQQMGYPLDSLIYEPTMVRGLDYYTGLIIEVSAENYPIGSVGGGGRYDKLLSLFTKKSYPSVGFSFGFDRTMEAIEINNLFPEKLSNSTTRVLVTIFNSELEKESFYIASTLRNKSVNVEVFFDKDSKMEKQLKYADKKSIPYVIIIGPEEKEKNVVKLKNMKERTEETFTLDEVVKKLS